MSGFCAELGHVLGHFACPQVRDRALELKRFLLFLAKAKGEPSSFSRLMLLGFHGFHVYHQGSPAEGDLHAMAARGEHRVGLMDAMTHWFVARPEHILKWISFV